MPSVFEISCQDWHAPFANEIQQRAVAALEQGQIILLPSLDFRLLPQERVFLSPHFAKLKAKNISFDLKTDTIRGVKKPIQKNATLKNMLERYNRYSTQLMVALFPHYQSQLSVGRTSFRPIEIENRLPRSYRKDDTRLHVDAFPSTPMGNQRIFRVFTNINPNGQHRLWRVGDSFENVALHFLPKLKKSWPARAKIYHWLRLTRTRSQEYDYLMCQLHDRMKADLHYQKNVDQQKIAFAPGSSWIVATDLVSHAAIRGQHVLEQTFYLPAEAMYQPEYSPLHILERLTRKKLVV